MTRFYFFFMFSYFFGLALHAQPKEIMFSELEQVMATDPKPVVVFMHTDWCSYCALMEKKTLNNDKVMQKLDEDFYFISFNAEQEEAIEYKGKRYELRKTGVHAKQHELAKELAQSNAYPAVIFLNEKLEIMYRHFAYVRSNDMYKLLNAIKPS
ncbi:thioredoxin family protein [Myroides odoratimimus]|uniref:Uncharacterized protein n=4 Tax=Myroides odoratimimus TaxID=76832 RepID=A0A0U3G657_9FLAO|nr:MULTISPECIES: thioredoxin family protein [Myroides]AJA68208.1 Thioredoxin-like domain [Myroides sp. A21]ALU25509.1 hypothetical protein AS202_04795 [Myroides odoratimimus]EHO04772.1 hypothetical protein HMPREF9714_03609 [Myroides odoratimimus CCUG 12901]EHO05996.1 hypothetical protein HMPREF9715_03173 [Myroides odoratimimus CIP 101113]EHO06873.1 hypothetical protein HMPREF9712_03078 [Myroides odoratimimus CCUG 10230]